MSKSFIEVIDSSFYTYSKVDNSLSFSISSEDLSVLDHLTPSLSISRLSHVVSFHCQRLLCWAGSFVSEKMSGLDLQTLLAKWQISLETRRLETHTPALKKGLFLFEKVVQWARKVKTGGGLLLERQMGGWTKCGANQHSEQRDGILIARTEEAEAKGWWRRIIKKDFCPMETKLKRDLFLRPTTSPGILRSDVQLVPARGSGVRILGLSFGKKMAVLHLELDVLEASRGIEVDLEVKCKDTLFVFRLTAQTEGFEVGLMVEDLQMVPVWRSLVYWLGWLGLFILSWKWLKTVVRLAVDVRALLVFLNVEGIEVKKEEGGMVQQKERVGESLVCNRISHNTSSIHYDPHQSSQQANVLKSSRKNQEQSILNGKTGSEHSNLLAGFSPPVAGKRSPQESPNQNQNLSRLFTGIWKKVVKVLEKVKNLRHVVSFFVRIKDQSKRSSRKKLKSGKKTQQSRRKNSSRKHKRMAVLESAGEWKSRQDHQHVVNRASLIKDLAVETQLQTIREKQEDFGGQSQDLFGLLQKMMKVKGRQQRNKRKQSETRQAERRKDSNSQIIASVKDTSQKPRKGSGRDASEAKCRIEEVVMEYQSPMKRVKHRPRRRKSHPREMPMYVGEEESILNNSMFYYVGIERPKLDFEKQATPKNSFWELVPRETLATPKKDIKGNLIGADEAIRTLVKETGNEVLTELDTERVPHVPRNTAEIETANADNSQGEMPVSTKEIFRPLLVFSMKRKFLFKKVLEKIGEKHSDFEMEWPSENSQYDAPLDWVSEQPRETEKEKEEEEESDGEDFGVMHVENRDTHLEPRETEEDPEPEAARMDSTILKLNDTHNYSIEGKLVDLIGGEPKDTDIRSNTDQARYPIEEVVRQKTFDHPRFLKRVDQNLSNIEPAKKNNSYSHRPLLSMEEGPSRREQLPRFSLGNFNKGFKVKRVEEMEETLAFEEEESEGHSSQTEEDRILKQRSRLKTESYQVIGSISSSKSGGSNFFKNRKKNKIRANKTGSYLNSTDQLLSKPDERNAETMPLPIFGSKSGTIQTQRSFKSKKGKNKKRKRKRKSYLEDKDKRKKTKAKQTSIGRFQFKAVDDKLMREKPSGEKIGIEKEKSKNWRVDGYEESSESFVREFEKPSRSYIDAMKLKRLKKENKEKEMKKERDRRINSHLDPRAMGYYPGMQYQSEMVMGNAMPMGKPQYYYGNMPQMAMPNYKTERVHPMYSPFPNQKFYQYQGSSFGMPQVPVHHPYMENSRNVYKRSRRKASKKNPRNANLFGEDPAFRPLRMDFDVPKERPRVRTKPVKPAHEQKVKPSSKPNAPLEKIINFESSGEEPWRKQDRTGADDPFLEVLRENTPKLKSKFPSRKEWEVKAFDLERREDLSSQPSESDGYEGFSLFRGQKITDDLERIFKEDPKDRIETPMYTPKDRKVSEHSPEKLEWYEKEIMEVRKLEQRKREEEKDHIEFNYEKELWYMDSQKEESDVQGYEEGGDLAPQDSSEKICFLEQAEDSKAESQSQRTQKGRGAESEVSEESSLRTRKYMGPEGESNQRPRKRYGWRSRRKSSSSQNWTESY